MPNRRHRLDASAFRRHYPALKIICPAAVRPRVEKVVRVDGGYEMLPREIGWRTLATKGDEAAFILRHRDRTTVVFGDVLFNAPHFGGTLGRIFRVIGSTGGPRITPLAKRLVVANKSLLAAQFHELAATPGLVRMVPGPGQNIEREAAKILYEVPDRI